MNDKTTRGTGSQAPVFRATGLSKAFGRHRVLRDLDLELTPGTVTALLGANGSGKSTLLRIALGAQRAESGTIEVFGHDPLRSQRAILQRTGYVPSTPDVYDWMRPGDLFRFLRPQYPTWDQGLCDQLCDGLRVPRKTRFAKMSRGEGMKAMLVAALAPRPTLLLLDEPFGGLDPIAQDEILGGVVTNLRDQQCTVLCATHDLAAVSLVADRVAILAEGRIARHVDLEELVTDDAPDRSAPSVLKSALIAESTVRKNTSADRSEVSV